MQGNNSCLPWKFKQKWIRKGFSLWSLGSALKLTPAKYMLAPAAHTCRSLKWHIYKLRMFDRYKGTCVKISQTLTRVYLQCNLNHKGTFVFCSVALLIHKLRYETFNHKRNFDRANDNVQWAVVWQAGGFVSWWGRTAGMLNHNNTSPSTSVLAVALCQNQRGISQLHKQSLAGLLSL